MGFSQRECAGGILLSVSKWDEVGLKHGFVGNLGIDGPQRLRSALSAAEIFMPKQVHGNEIWTIEAKPKEKCADGMSFELLTANRLMVIQTADCLPIMLKGENGGFVLVHCGWRGLANGILDSAADCFRNEEKVELAIGPSASFCNYEVGREVIDAIGSSAVFMEKSREKFCLNLAESAKKQLSRRLALKQAYLSNICTISDSRFSSYRRDGKGAGRNLAFVMA